MKEKKDRDIGNSSCIIGIGGAGNNILVNVCEKSLDDYDYIAIDTAKEGLAIMRNRLTNCRIIQIGKELTKGLGAGARPEIGQRAFEESKKEIEYCLRQYKRICLVCGLGGGTGTGVTPMILKMAKDLNIEVAVFATMPFKFEARTRTTNAEAAKEMIFRLTDDVYIFTNDSLLEKVDKQVSTSELFSIVTDIILENIYRWNR